MAEAQERNKVYVVKCLSGNVSHKTKEDALDPCKKFRSANGGYYFDRKDAECLIDNNCTDISELGYYQYAVLCEVGEGPLPDGEELQWYEFIWDFDVAPRQDGVLVPEFKEAKKIEKPEKYRSLWAATL